MVLDLYSILTLILLFTLLLLMIVSFSNINKSKSNIYFSLFYISQALTFSNILLYNVSNASPAIYHLHNVIPPLWYTWAPFMYLAICFELNLINRFSWRQLLHFLPASLFTLYLIFAYHLKPLETKMELMEQGRLFHLSHYHLNLYFNIIQVLIYNVVTVLAFKKYMRVRKPLTKLQKSKAQWLEFIIYGYFIACLVYDLMVLVHRDTQNVVLAIFFLYFAFVLYKALTNSYFSFSMEKNRYLLLTSKRAEQLQKQLNKIITEEKPYLDFELTLTKLAQMLNEKESHLSELINVYYHTNFYNLINKYRIEYAKTLLLDKNNKSKTILEILYASGFNSKSAFNASFKKEIGMSPTQFRKANSTKKNEN